MNTHSQGREGRGRDLSGFKMFFRFDKLTRFAQPNLAKLKSQEDVHTKDVSWPGLAVKMKIQK